MRRSYRAPNYVNYQPWDVLAGRYPSLRLGRAPRQGTGPERHWDSDKAGSEPHICNSKAWARAGSPLGAELVAGIVGASRGCAGTAATPGQPMAGQELARSGSFQEGSPMQLSKTCSLAPGANFQELLAACMSSLLRILSSPAELPLPFPSTLDGEGTASSAPAQLGHRLPALVAPLALPALLAQAG